MKPQLILTGGLNVTNVVLGFVVSTLLVWVLGARGYGTYSYVFVIFSILSIVAQLGVPRVVMRETARARVEEDWARIRTLWIWAGRAVLMMSAAIGGGAMVLTWILLDTVGAEHRGLVMLGATLVPLTALTILRGAILRGLGKVVLGQFPQMGVSNLALAVLVGAVWLWGTEISPAAAMGLKVTATSIALLSGVWLLSIHTPEGVRAAQAVMPDSRMWWRAALFIGLSAGMTQINNYVDILILGIFRPASDVGVYRIAYQMSNLVVLGLQAVSLVFAPRFASLHALDERARLQHLATASAWLSALLAMPIALVFFLFGSQILRGIFGEDFAPGYLPLFVLATAQLVNASFGAIGVLMTMTRNESMVTIALVLAAVANLSLNFVLVPAFGMTGAAAATLVGTAIWNLTLLIFVRKKLGISSHAFAFRSSAWQELRA